MKIRNESKLKLKNWNFGNTVQESSNDSHSVAEVESIMLKRDNTDLGEAIGSNENFVLLKGSEGRRQHGKKSEVQKRGYSN